MKNLSKVLALVLVVAMIFSFAVSASAATSYKDDASIKNQEAVELLSALNVLNGYTDGTFKPAGSITRGEFAVMVSYMVANEWSETPLYSDIYKLGKDYAPLCSFADTKDHWAAGYVAFCAGNGYISGRNANVFDPDATITAAEISVILLRVMGYNAKIEDFGTTAGTTKGYNTQVTARNAGLLNGLENMNFFKPATRDEAAQLMFNALNGSVVNYGLNDDFSLVLTDANGNQTTLTLGGKLHTLDIPLMRYCFRNVASIPRTTIDGRSGHQWVAYESVRLLDGNQLGLSGQFNTLTSIYPDDSQVGAWLGTTPYSKIASDLGITAKSTGKVTEVYVNGYLVGGSDYHGATTVGIPTYISAELYDLPMSLIDLYHWGVGAGINPETGEPIPTALDDNCRLQVTRMKNRLTGVNEYKLLFFYEFVGKVTDIYQVTDAHDPFYGDYVYEMSYWYTYPWAAAGDKVGYVVSESKSILNTNDYYLVEPNESGEDMINISANYKNVETYADFLSIKVAKTEAPVTMIEGAEKTFADNVDKYVVDTNAKRYEVSKYAHDFYKPGTNYRQPLLLVYNTAGHVQGFDDATKVTPNATGYVYIDSLEFEVTKTQSAKLIRKLDGTFSAQAKALAYFPKEGGNSKAEVIDLSINPRTWTVEVASCNYDEIPFSSDTYVLEDYIRLPDHTTNGFYDVTGDVYLHSISGTIRVYDEWFDGWYKFTKYSDGRYGLKPVDWDYADVDKGYAKPNAAEKIGFGETSGTDVSSALLTSTTSDHIYKMDLSKMTAYEYVVTGYKNIATGIHGYQPDDDSDGYSDGLYLDPVTGDPLIMPYQGAVGGVLTLSRDEKTITRIDEFQTVSDNTKLAFALYKTRSGWNANNGYAAYFVGTGDGYKLYFADSVRYIDKDGTDTIYTSEEDLLDDLDAKNGEENCYAVVLDDANKICALVNYNLIKTEVETFDADSYVVVGTDPVNFVKDSVWSYHNGKADKVAKADAAYWVDVDYDGDPDTPFGVAPLLWVAHKGAAPTSFAGFVTPKDDDEVLPWWE